MENINSTDTYVAENEEAALTSTPDITADEADNTDHENGGVTESADAQHESETGVDYEALIADDVATLKAEFPELSGISDVTDLNNPLRYAALRDLGLTPQEAYLATAKRITRDTRAHLRSAHGRNAASGFGTMSYSELATARELFPEKSDAELHKLYKRVNR